LYSEHQLNDLKRPFFRALNLIRRIGDLSSDASNQASIAAKLCHPREPVRQLRALPPGFNDPKSLTHR
jgi:hypothetical protein